MPPHIPGMDAPGLVLIAVMSLLPLDDVMPLLADLARRGAYGVHGGERAAFLVSDVRGEVRCVLWPNGAQARTASHRGPVPPGTFAIVHTHPRCCRSLSAHDHREAARLKMPIVAVSKDSVHVADPFTPEQQPRWTVDWAHFERPDRRCVD